MIILWRSHEFFLVLGYFMNMQDECNILPKTINMISIDDHRERVFDFMPYHYCFDINLIA